MILLNYITKISYVLSSNIGHRFSWMSCHSLTTIDSSSKYNIYYRINSRSSK
jgi:hypothetical protein